MSRGKRFESARRLFTTGLDKPHGRNWRSPRSLLEAAPIGGQPFAQDISRRDCTAFLLLFDTYDTRLLAQALRHLIRASRSAFSRGSSQLWKPILLGAYAKPTCASGSAKPNEMPKPGVP